MKQTAVEWFEYNLKDNLGKIVIKQNWELLEDLIKQAKEMEKEQNELWWAKGWNEGYISTLQENTETFKSE